jgi:hypothetical protein
MYCRNPQLKPSRLPPLLIKLGKRGGLWTCPKSEAHALGCRPRGASSHWSSNSLQTFRTVPEWDSQWNFEEIEAMWGCASQVWVPGRSSVHGRPYFSFCPISLQQYSFKSLWVCRCMQNLKRSRLVTFLSGWGHWKGVWGGGPSEGSTPKVDMPSKKK